MNEFNNPNASNAQEGNSSVKKNRVIPIGAPSYETEDWSVTEEEAPIVNDTVVWDEVITENESTPLYAEEVTPVSGVFGGNGPELTYDDEYQAGMANEPAIWDVEPITGDMVEQMYEADAWNESVQSHEAAQDDAASNRGVMPIAVASSATASNGTQGEKGTSQSMQENEKHEHMHKHEAAHRNKDNSTDKKPKEKMPKKKRRITAAVIVGVIVIAVIGLLVWHEQPSFCSAICHTPMDAYGKTYDGKVDAFANELTPEEANSMLAYAHSKYMGGITCMGCHEPVLSEQVSEGLAWVAGDYYIEGYNKDGDALIEPRSLADLTEARGVPAVEFCLNDKCHVTTPDRAALFEKTKYLESEYNPHSDRHGDVSCSMCHKGHTQSINYCTECHASAPVPEGWLSMTEAQEMGIIPELNVLADGE